MAFSMVLDEAVDSGYLEAKNMKRHGIAAALIFGGMLALFPQSILAEDTSRNMTVSRKAEDQAICLALRASISKGADALVVARTAIELGHNPCFVIKCTLIGGGDLAKIVTAAIQAGVTSDVISRCAADAGADLNELAALLLRKELGLSICYFPPVEDGVSAILATLPPESPVTGSYSPYKF